MGCKFNHTSSEKWGQVCVYRLKVGYTIYTIPCVWITPRVVRHFWDVCSTSVSFLSNLVFAFTEGWDGLTKQSVIQNLLAKVFLTKSGWNVRVVWHSCHLFSHTTHSYSSELQRDFLGIKKDFCKYISRSSNQVSGRPSCSKRDQFLHLLQMAVLHYLDVYLGPGWQVDFCVFLVN